MASLRAVAYPLVQEARRWPPPSPRLIWPIRLSVVVTWRRDPTAVCWPSFHPPVPPAGAPFPPRGLVGSIPPLRRYYETRRLLAVHPPALRCLRPGGTIRAPAASLRRTPGAASTASGLVSRCPPPGGLYDGDDEASRVPGKPTRTHATRSDPGEVAASTASEMRRDDLPSNARRRPVKGGAKLDHRGGGKLDHPAVEWLKAAVRRRGQDAGAAAGWRAFLLCSRR